MSHWHIHVNDEETKASYFTDDFERVKKLIQEMSEVDVHRVVIQRPMMDLEHSHVDNDRWRWIDLDREESSSADNDGN